MKQECQQFHESSIRIEWQISISTRTNECQRGRDGENEKKEKMGDAWGGTSQGNNPLKLGIRTKAGQTMSAILQALVQARD